MPQCSSGIATACAQGAIVGNRDVEINRVIGEKALGNGPFNRKLAAKTERIKRCSYSAVRFESLGFRVGKTC